ncbi:MAG: hypothetical protein P8N94_10935 [Gammaproteobacteria bacterium]|nr:hypothetical protein [Gammaproteobacteria bacterium]MDG2338482.1 hypothetical protein [Gammaproteobacteria bacterium]
MKRTISQILICIGVLAGSISAAQTFGHIQDESYQVVNLAVEEESTVERTVTHSNYHAFRESLIAFAILGCLVYLCFSPSLSRDAWILGFVLACVYTLGWWLPWPLFGLRAPHLMAEIVHGVATASLLTGYAMLRPLEKANNKSQK